MLLITSSTAPFLDTDESPY